MRLSAASRAVSIRIGTSSEAPRIDLAKSKPDSPGIITSRMSRSKLRLLQLGARVRRRLRGGDAIALAGEEARQQIADAAVVVDDQQMRRVVRERVGQHCQFLACHVRPAFGALGARDQPQHALAIVGVDHGGEEAARRLMRVGPEFAEGAVDALGLQAGELERQRLALRRHVEQALAAVLRALLLHHVALVDQLLEHAAERLLGDVEDVEQVGDLHAGIAVDEMQHPVMGAAEAELGEHLVGVADEIAVGEEQQLDDVPDRLRRRRPGTLGAGRRLRRQSWRSYLCQPC